MPEPRRVGGHHPVPTTCAEVQGRPAYINPGSDDPPPGGRGRSILPGLHSGRLVAAPDHLLDLPQQTVASRLASSEEAIFILFGLFRGTVEVEPEVQSLTDPHHLVEKLSPPVASEDEIDTERKERDRENGAVFGGIDHQLQLENGEITN